MISKHRCTVFSNSFEGVLGIVIKYGSPLFCVLRHFYDHIFLSLLRGYMRCHSKKKKNRTYFFIVTVAQPIYALIELKQF
jgi:hypothetical protein